MEQLGRSLIFVGLLLAGVGLLFLLGDRLPFRLGRLPLDIHWQSKNTHIYFPLGTSLLISAVLTLLMWLFSRR
ncbi:MAG: DUF2905 domain-containing protein [Bryobacteraceae bacterium]|nr:DUF2905 domain-containing protein [Bryobacteraceae bacterium]MDW8377344.1 DUF2905 domain-containing protein [Bryobacterales bacterium]